MRPSARACRRRPRELGMPRCCREPRGALMLLDRILTSTEVAAIAGWPRRRMLRHLLRLHERHGGGVLVNVGTPGGRPRWTTTLGALKRIAPQWIIDEEDITARV